MKKLVLILMASTALVFASDKQEKNNNELHQIEKEYEQCIEKAEIITADSDVFNRLKRERYTRLTNKCLTNYFFNRLEYILKNQKKSDGNKP